MIQIPQELDWVNKRAACTIEQVFTKLMEGVEKDVAAANKAFSAPPEQPLFKVLTGVLDTQFTVQRWSRVKRIIFSRMEDRIVITSDLSNQQWEYTIGLNNEGRCLLRQGEKELEQWQVRKIALESMFFGQ